MKKLIYIILNIFWLGLGTIWGGHAQSLTPPLFVYQKKNIDTRQRGMLFIMGFGMVH